jgi:hypothetical protein
LPEIDKEDRMALARVVAFEGVSTDRMEEMKREISTGEPPEGFPPGELIVLYDAGAETALVIGIFQSEDDYNRADEILNAIPADETPGRRTSVQKHDVALRMSN